MTFTSPLAAHASHLLLTTAIFVIAGLVKGVLGLGLPTVSMALLGALMTPAEAAALLIVPSLITNIWQIGPLSAVRQVLGRLAPMQIGICIGTLIGAWAFGAPVGSWAVVLLGTMLIVYAAWSLAGARLLVPARAERWLGPLVGMCTGLTTAVTGVFVIPAVPYLQALGLQRDALMKAMGLSFTISTLAMATALCFESHVPSAVLGESTFLVLPALAGMSMGERLSRHLSPPVFRLGFFSSLFLLGVYMIASEWVGR